MVQEIKVLDPNKYSWIIFDLDETLGELNANYLGVRQELASLVQNDSRINFAQADGRYENEIVKLYGKEMLGTINDVLEKYEHQNLDNFKPYHDLLDFIKVYDKARLGLYTSNLRSTATYVLEKYSVWDRFSYTITRDDVVYIKPNPEGFTTFFKAYPEVSKDEMLFVGNSGADNDAAHAAGVQFIHRDVFAKLIKKM